jgi:hypothetical protein
LGIIIEKDDKENHAVLGTCAHNTSKWWI